MATQGIFLKTCNFFYNNRILLSNRILKVNVLPQLMHLKSETMERLKILNVPEKPKKPISPYMRFIKEKRLILSQENPSLKQYEIIKKLAEDWKHVSNELKSKYTEIYKKESEIYDKEILSYKAKLNEEQKAALRDVENEKRTERKKRKMKKLIRETNKPKRPIAPYMKYVLEQSRIRNVQLVTLMSTLKEEWSSLSEAEKQQYYDQYTKEKKEYNIALSEWETKMIREGHEDIIRPKTLEVKRPSRIRELKNPKLQ